MSKITIVEINENHPKIIAKAFQDQGWNNKKEEQYSKYLEMHGSGEMTVLLAIYDGEFAGYGTIKWQSHYNEFRDSNIPEIVDLNTLIKFRKKGIASVLLDELERLIFISYNVAGIGVGLVKDYGPAQKLYVKRGYIPNAKGAYYNNNNLGYFEKVVADDDLVIYLTKKRIQR